MLSLDVGGTERHILNLVSNLNKEKFNSVVCCLYDIGTIGTKLFNLDINIKIYHNLMRSRWDISVMWNLTRILKKEKIDILLTVSSPPTQLWGVVCARLSKVKVNITRVGGTKLPSDGKRRIVNKIMLPFVDRVIAQAYSHKNYLIRSEGFKPEKIEVIYNSVNLEQFNKPIDSQYVRKELGIPEGLPIIGIVARLSPEKGHIVFLKAAKKIINIFPDTWFLIVGDGKEREKLEEMTRKLAIQSNVYFLGVREDILRIISLFDVAVLASFPIRETFSNAILEYMAAAKPVVATKVGSISEQVVDGETGFLISPGDSDAIANAILRLLQDRKLAKKMGERGRERVEENFTLQKMVAKYESLFEDLVK